MCSDQYTYFLRESQVPQVHFSHSIMRSLSNADSLVHHLLGGGVGQELSNVMQESSNDGRVVRSYISARSEIWAYLTSLRMRQLEDNARAVRSIHQCSLLRLDYILSTVCIRLV
jgi:hypothetical protein